VGATTRIDSRRAAARLGEKKMNLRIIVEVLAVWFAVSLLFSICLGAWLRSQDERTWTFDE
jgi:hypothetical protein